MTPDETVSSSTPGEKLGEWDRERLSTRLTRRGQYRLALSRTGHAMIYDPANGQTFMHGDVVSTM